MLTTEAEQQQTRQALRTPVRYRRSSTSRRRNRMFGIMLACIAVLVFATAITLAILFNYLERHHALPKF
jgi:hypothetical protein